VRVNPRSARPAPAATSAHVLENRHTGERLALRRLSRGDETWLELKGSLPPRREGPPLHIHHQELEEGRVISGTLGATLDGRTIQVAAGQDAAFPIGSAHRWWNAGDETLVFEGYVKPVVDLDVYLQAVFEIINAGPADRPPLFYMAHLAWRHRRTQTVLFAPRWVQTFLVPSIVAIGTVLGRYRGTDWPGCPTRCSQAPLAVD
jgi:mannose-6-phosphate isomerase-like protein (cupin superfamily)